MLTGVLPRNEALRHGPPLRTPYRFCYGDAAADNSSPERSKDAQRDDSKRPTNDMAPAQDV